MCVCWGGEWNAARTAPASWPRPYWPATVTTCPATIFSLVHEPGGGWAPAGPAAPPNETAGRAEVGGALRRLRPIARRAPLSPPHPPVSRHGAPGAAGGGRGAGRHGAARGTAARLATRGERPAPPAALGPGRSSNAPPGFARNPHLCPAFIAVIKPK